MKESRHHYHRPEKTQRIQNEQNKQQQIEQPTGTQQTKSITWSQLRTSKTEKRKKTVMLRSLPNRHQEKITSSLPRYPSCDQEREF
jgi:hypothetical protein